MEMPSRTRSAKFQEENSTVCKMMHEKVPHRLQSFKNDLGADGQESVDLEGEVELPRNKEESEFPQHQMGDEQLPIKKEEEHFTWSLDAFGKREDVLGVARGVKEPANTTTWPLIKVEEPEFPQQQMGDEQLPIKKEEDYFTWSTVESVNRDYLGVASEGADPANITTWPLIKEEPEFLQQCKREEQPSIKNEEYVKWSTGEPFKSEPFKNENDQGVVNTGVEPLSVNSTEGWIAENVVAPLSDGNDLLFDDDDVKDVKKNPGGDKLCKCFQCGKTFGTKFSLKTHIRSHTGKKPFSCTVCGKRFTQKGNLNSHARTHTGDKPFSCSFCGQGFTQKETLKTHIRTHTGFRNNLGAYGQESVELSQNKKGELEFPQQQMEDEQSPIKKEEDHLTWSLSVFVKREDILSVASGGAEPANTTTWPIFKEEPEFPQQQMREEQLTIKKEEDFFTWSPGESVKRDYLGIAGKEVELSNITTWPLIKEEPEFPQQSNREEQSPVKNEECLKWSTGEPFKNENGPGVDNRGAELLSGSSTKRWQAGNLIAPLSNDNNLLFDEDDVEDVKENPRGNKLCKCSVWEKFWEKVKFEYTYDETHWGETFMYSLG
ncbi:uncharacterized protein LOC144213446 isoform X1 [Stigmatopora nigra]